MLPAVPRGLVAQIHMGMLFLSLCLHSSPASGGGLWPDAQEGGAGAGGEGGAGGGGGDTLNHSLALTRRLEALLAGGEASDVTLRVEAAGGDQVKLIQAHALVLSLQSPVFQRLLLANASALALRESADCSAIFDRFIRYLYCGEISLSPDQATPLHQLATKYQVLGLQKGVAQYMLQNLAPGRAVGWYQYALRTGDEPLRQGCLRFLSWNLAWVLRGPAWPSVPSDLLLALLRRSDLVLHSEMELFQALEVWIGQNRPDGLTAENALRSVRYAMMPPRDLLRLQARSATLARYQESVRDLLYMSYQFHSAPPLLMAQFFDVNCSLFVPRNYLAPAWGVAWPISSPARDDRSTSFLTQLGPSGHDANKRVTWNALFSPRWLPAGGGGEGGRPRVLVTPATASGDFAGVSFQKTALVTASQQGALVVRHVYDFHQSTEETGDFLAEADLQRRASDYLVDGALYLHIVVKPVYQTLVATKD